MHLYAGDDVARGGGGNDVIYGGAGNDELSGGAGKDDLHGGPGRDILVGGGDYDSLWGGAGKDVFRFNGIASTVEKQDYIMDFERFEDVIDLRGIDANTRLAGDQAFIWAGYEADFSGRPGELTYTTSRGAAEYTWIIGDVDGDRIGDFGVFLSNATSLSPGDFLM